MQRPSRQHRQSAAQQRRKLLSRPLSLERVEERALMTVFGPLAELATQPTQVLDPLPVAMAEGSIVYSSTTRALTVEGSDTQNDTVNIYINHRGGGLSDLLTVSEANINVPRVYAINPSTVDKIFFNGYGGNDLLDNRTGIAVQADGGLGDDVLLGGRGSDFLMGGDGNDYLDGRLGDDMLFGQGGVDALFGDDGNDSLYGGNDTDYVFGGNGIDYLYGEGGSDKLYGGAGLDNLRDITGTNTLYTDYGPDYTVSASGFSAFDWFDKNLKDPTVRSLARFEFRDGVLNRGDMLHIYTIVATDGVESAIPINGSVSINELADLKALTSTRLNFQLDTGFFARRIALGDAANAHYQGGTLGNLAAGVSGDHLNKLVDKWFMGGDVPVAVDSDHDSLRYERAEGTLFVNGPSFTDINQGSIGDCYFMAALGSVAQRSPSTIRNMFADNGDGTWTVRFIVGGAQTFVTVNRMLPVIGNQAHTLPASGPGTPWAAGWGQDDTGALRSSDDLGNELWVALAEKAYVQLNESGNIGQDGSNRYFGIDGGWVSDAMKHISGQTASTQSLSVLAGPQGLINALSAGRAVGIDTKEHPGSNLITPLHAYIVTGYNATTQRFQLFNPHGFVNGDAPDGSAQSPIVEVDWAALLDNFTAWAAVTV